MGKRRGRIRVAQDQRNLRSWTQGLFEGDNPGVWKFDGDEDNHNGDSVKVSST